jgi:hypothetical protein
VGECGLDSSGSGKGPKVSPCEHGNELPVSMKGGEFHEELKTYYFFKTIFAPWSCFVDVRIRVMFLGWWLNPK